MNSVIFFFLNVAAIWSTCGFVFPNFNIHAIFAILKKICGYEFFIKPILHRLFVYCIHQFLIIIYMLNMLIHINYMTHQVCHYRVYCVPLRTIHIFSICFWCIVHQFYIHVLLVVNKFNLLWKRLFFVSQYQFLVKSIYKYTASLILQYLIMQMLSYRKSILAMSGVHECT